MRAHHFTARNFENFTLLAVQDLLSRTKTHLTQDVDSVGRTVQSIPHAHNASCNHNVWCACPPLHYIAAAAAVRGTRPEDTCCRRIFRLAQRIAA